MQQPERRGRLKQREQRYAGDAGRDVLGGIGMNADGAQHIGIAGITQRHFVLSPRGSDPEGQDQK